VTHHTHAWEEDMHKCAQAWQCFSRNAAPQARLLLVAQLHALTPIVRNMYTLLMAIQQARQQGAGERRI